MKYLAETTLVLGGDSSVDHVFFHPIQPTIEEMVMLTKSSVNPTLFLDSDKSKEVKLPMKSLANPTILLGVDASFDHVLIIFSYVPFEQVSFHSLYVHSLQVLGWFPLIEMILWSLSFLLLHPYR
jgi:hypothetical protein